MKIGYVGLGAMGGALVRWLIPHHDVMVRDLNPDAVAACVSAGARAADTAEELARNCDVIFLCLPRSSNVEEALFGADGLAGALSPGKIVVDQTSGLAHDTRRFARQLAEQGVAMLDAPVAGGVPNAEAGTITIMVSGAATALETVMPAFRHMTTRIYHASENVGDAQAVKTLNNMMNMVMRVATLELAALAVKMGIPLPALTDALIAGVGGNFTTRTVLPAIVAGRSTGDFRLLLMLKDNNQALALGRSCDVPMPLSALARAVVQQNIHITGPGAGLDEVITFMEQACGHRFADGAADLPTGEAQRLTAILATALAACNRAISYETLSVAARQGMDLRAFGDILNNGSAWSRECEAILDELDSGQPCPRRLGETVAALREVEDLAVANGMTIIMSGAVRAFHETALATLGPEAGLDRLAALYEAAGGVSLRTTCAEPA